LKLGDGYKPLERTNYCHIENGRLQLTLDSTRGVLCAVFGLTRDELADYLDGRQGLPAVLAARSAREASRPSRRTKAHPRQKQSAPHV